jgi:hypothetical protein
MPGIVASKSNLIFNVTSYSVSLVGEGLNSAKNLRVLADLFEVLPFF